MAFKLSDCILTSITNFIESFNKDLILVTATNALLRGGGCNGCSGDCNMTCKGGCGSKHGV